MNLKLGLSIRQSQRFLMSTGLVSGMPKGSGSVKRVDCIPSQSTIISGSALVGAMLAPLHSEANATCKGTHLAILRRLQWLTSSEGSGITVF